METTDYDLVDENEQKRDDASALVVQLPGQARARLVAIEAELLGELARVADDYARDNVFTERQEAKAWNSVHKEIAALSNFMVFLRQSADLSLSFHLAEEPRLWQAVTFGLVKLFLRWMQMKGYRIKTINDHLDVIKLYARMAHDAGFQTADQLLSITHIPRIRGAQAERIDAAREQRDIPTHVGHKKADPTFLEDEEFQALLHRPDTPQGWRDRVAILLMYDLSLRPGEAVSLKLKDLNMDERTLHITRHKTHDQQKARLTQRLYAALTGYLRLRRDRSPEAPLLVRSLKSEPLLETSPREEPETEAARRGGRRPYSPNRALYVQRQPGDQATKSARRNKKKGKEDLWTPPITTRALAKHLHSIGLHIESELYQDTRAPEERLNLTSYDGRHEWTRRAIRHGSDPIAVTKAGGWKGHSAMVARYYGELEIVNEDIILE
ncbi:MAG: hypothetical protein NVS3B14_05320 [Ktedonobacteraceae bacterium]